MWWTPSPPHVGSGLAVVQCQALLLELIENKTGFLYPLFSGLVSHHPVCTFITCEGFCVRLRVCVL